MLTVTIIGVGRVGGALALSLPPDKYTIENLVVRENGDVASIAKARDRPAIASCDALSALSSDIVFITTPDSAIASVAGRLDGKPNGSTVVLHTSGALSSAILGDLKSDQVSVGSLHPLVSISSAELGPERFRGAFFCVEGDPAAVKVADAIARDLGGKPFTIDSKKKTLHHAAAVTACGHLVALFDASVEMMTAAGLSPEQSAEILMPLVESTVENLKTQSTATALTGTFARADVETFSRHLAALNELGADDLLQIYLLLGERSLELAASAGVDGVRIEKIRAKMAVAKSKLKW